MDKFFDLQRFAAKALTWNSGDSVYQLNGDGSYTTLQSAINAAGSDGLSLAGSVPVTSSTDFKNCPVTLSPEGNVLSAFVVTGKVTISNLNATCTDASGGDSNGYNIIQVGGTDLTREQAWAYAEKLVGKHLTEKQWNW